MLIDRKSKIDFSSSNRKQVGIVLFCSVLFNRELNNTTTEQIGNKEIVSHSFESHRSLLKKQLIYLLVNDRQKKKKKDVELNEFITRE